MVKSLAGKAICGEYLAKPTHLRKKVISWFEAFEK